MKTTIAIVDDTLQVREHIVTLLNQSEAFTCVGAYSNADEALRELVVQKPKIVILDIHLNEQLTGLDILKRMKPLLPDTDFLMFTIFEDDKTVFEAIREGATGYLLKSTSDTKLMDALIEIADGGAPMSPRIARQVLQIFQKKK